MTEVTTELIPIIPESSVPPRGGITEENAGMLGTK